MNTSKLFFAMAVIGCGFLASCYTVSYIGEQYPINRNVEVYYDYHDVKREYKVIGHMRGGANDPKTELRNKAIMIGADAIVIKGVIFTGGKESTAEPTADALKWLDDKQAVRDSVGRR